MAPTTRIDVVPVADTANSLQVTAVTDCVIYRLRRSDLVVSVEKSTELKIRLRRHREEEAKRKQDEETAAMAETEEKELAEWKAEATGKDAHQVCYMYSMLVVDLASVVTQRSDTAMF